jgi:membrane protein implicated in regulation of membrane protease activity
MWQFWLIAAGVFFVGEIITVGFLIFWLGIAALLTMIVSFFTSNLIIQTAVFVMSSAILIFATKPLVNKISKKETVPTNVFSIIGKSAIVIKDINCIDGTGQIKVNGEVWSAEGLNGIDIKEGSKVEIIEIKGVKAIVSPIKTSCEIN